MASQRRASPLSPLATLTRHALAIPVRPFAAMTTAAVHASLDLQRRALLRVLVSPELDRILTAAINSEPAQAGIRRALESDAAGELVASLFEVGLFDQLVERARYELDAKKRDALYAQVAKLTHDEAPWIFLYQMEDLYGKSKRLHWQPRSDEILRLVEMSL